MGSGNVVHNLRDAFMRMRDGNRDTPAWAREFDDRIAAAIEARDHQTLATLHETEVGRMAHPTPEHWLPFLYVLGATTDDDPIATPIEGFDWGSLPMRAVRWG